MWIYILTFAGMAVGFGVAYLGYRIGLDMAETKRRLKAVSQCNDTNFRTAEVECPCLCGGVLRGDGRNTQDSRTFLLCTRCRCLYHADDTQLEGLRKTGAYLNVVRNESN